MQKILSFTIVGLLILGGLGAFAVSSNEEKLDSDNNNEKLDFSHTIFAEFGTSTGCPPCKYAHGALKNIYASGSYPFYFVTLINDKNSKAYSRLKNDLNCAATPTVYFDGGYKVRVGAGSVSSAQSIYEGLINSCGNRAASNIDISLGVTWLGDAKMDIDVRVDNNEATEYTGHIRVYVTEISSSMGWRDKDGYPYAFPFLDFAFNKDIAINAGSKWQESRTWYGNSNGYGSITENNIMVFAVVFNSERRQGYADPPSRNPFNAYYVDEATAATPGSEGENKPPETPLQPDGPNDGKVGIKYTFSSSTTDPDDDQIFYQFHWGGSKYSDWLGPHPSGETVTAKYMWKEPGDYEVRIKAKDNNLDEETDWSDPIAVHIEDGPILEIDEIKGGLFRISATIKNTGGLDAEDVEWEISLDGGFVLLGRETTGEISSIPSGEEKTITSGIILGFGQSKITVKAEINKGPEDEQDKTAFVLPFFIKI